MLETLLNHSQLFVRQRFEIAELFGYETRNKYEVLDSQGNPLLFAAEQQKGIFGFLFRQFFGHWRSFEILFFDQQRNLVLRAYHPFRFFFQRLEIFNAQGKMLGALQSKLAILSKRFDLETPDGRALMNVSSGLFRIWTFPFEKNGREVARVSKKWSGLGSEFFTDKDNFLVEFKDPGLTPLERSLLLSAALFIDLQYFEAKQD